MASEIIQILDQMLQRHSQGIESDKDRAMQILDLKVRSDETKLQRLYESRENLANEYRRVLDKYNQTVGAAKQLYKLGEDEDVASKDALAIIDRLKYAASDDAETISSDIKVYDQEIRNLQNQIGVFRQSFGEAPSYYESNREGTVGEDIYGQASLSDAETQMALEGYAESMGIAPDKLSWVQEAGFKAGLASTQNERMTDVIRAKLGELNASIATGSDSEDPNIGLIAGIKDELRVGNQRIMTLGKEMLGDKVSMYDLPEILQNTVNPLPYLRIYGRMFAEGMDKFSDSDLKSITDPTDNSENPRSAYDLLQEYKDTENQDKKDVIASKLMRVMDSSAGDNLSALDFHKGIMPWNGWKQYDPKLAELYYNLLNSYRQAATWQGINLGTNPVDFSTAYGVGTDTIYDYMHQGDQKKKKKKEGGGGGKTNNWLPFHIGESEEERKARKTQIKKNWQTIYNFLNSQFGKPFLNK